MYAYIYGNLISVEYIMLIKDLLLSFIIWYYFQLLFISRAFLLRSFSVSDVVLYV